MARAGPGADIIREERLVLFPDMALVTTFALSNYPRVGHARFCQGKKELNITFVALCLFSMMFCV
jgi:hypothetical protein